MMECKYKEKLKAIIRQGRKDISQSKVKGSVKNTKKKVALQSATSIEL